LAEFRENATETIERLKQTGEAEILTVDGEAKAVLLSPAMYDEMAREVMLARDVAVIERSMKQIKEGKFEEAGVLFDRLHANLLAMKAAQSQGTTK